MEVPVLPLWAECGVLKMIVELLPINKRYKELRKRHGKEWEVVEHRDRVLCFNNRGVRIKSQDGLHERWVKAEEIR